MQNSNKERVVSQRALPMRIAIYQSTEEIYGLAAQPGRAGVSLASNIAERYGRLTSREYKQFLGMAWGSNHEVQRQLQIAPALGFGSSLKLQGIEDQSNEISKMLGPC
jgi:four helix bundle protein